MKFTHEIFIVTATIVLAAALLASFAVTASATGVAGKERGDDSGDWAVSLTSTGGELSKAVVKIEIVVKAGSGKGTRTRTVDGVETKTEEVTIPSTALNRLSKTMEEVKAWDLPDFRKPVLDSPDYTIRLDRAGKTRTIKVQGASKSDVHLKLILAIQKCFSEGAPK
jgi:hypothetical protein